MTGAGLYWGYIIAVVLAMAHLLFFLGFKLLVFDNFSEYFNGNVIESVLVICIMKAIALVVFNKELWDIGGSAVFIAVICAAGLEVAWSIFCIIKMISIREKEYFKDMGGTAVKPRNKRWY
jgi:hypothetical protein